MPIVMQRPFGSHLEPTFFFIHYPFRSGPLGRILINFYFVQLINCKLFFYVHFKLEILLRPFGSHLEPSS